MLWAVSKRGPLSGPRLASRVRNPGGIRWTLDAGISRCCAGSLRALGTLSLLVPRIDRTPEGRRVPRAASSGRTLEEPVASRLDPERLDSRMPVRCTYNVGISPGA